MEPVTIRRISEAMKYRIDTLYQESLSPLQIRKRILSEYNTSISSQAIKLYLARRRAEELAGKKLPAARPRPEKRKLNKEHLAFIDSCLEEDDECTAPELLQKLTDRFQITVSVATVKRARQALGWTWSSTRYCQIVREVNMVKRKQYCLDVMRNDEQFDDVIFTDESTVKMQANVRLSFRRWGHRRRLKGIPKHPYQVHIWAGISRRGVTEIAVFSGKLDSGGYQEILKDFLLPFVNRRYPHGHRLYQDNDPKHTSKSTRKWMEENGVTTMKAPPESPDLNPIELMWASLKYYIRRTVRPRTKDDLIEGIYRFWETVSKDKCNKYIDHLYKVVPVVAAEDGAASGH